MEGYSLHQKNFVWQLGKAIISEMTPDDIGIYDEMAGYYIENNYQEDASPTQHLSTETTLYVLTALNLIWPVVLKHLGPIAQKIIKPGNEAKIVQEIQMQTSHFSLSIKTEIITTAKEGLAAREVLQDYIDLTTQWIKRFLFEAHALPDVGKYNVPANDKTVLILTPLPLELNAVLHHLTQRQKNKVKDQIAYEKGYFKGKRHEYDVIVAETGMKNTNMALLTERAIKLWSPDIAILCGIAGGIKDIKIGDVAIAKSAFDYDSGKESQGGFLPRHEEHHFSKDLLAYAQVVQRSDDWKKRTTNDASQSNIHIASVAAGDKVVAAVKNTTYERITQFLSHCKFLEMEAAGFGLTIERHRNVHGIVIRGISNLLDQKIDDFQRLAAERAAAVAFELLYQLDGRDFLKKPAGNNPMTGNTIHVENASNAIVANMVNVEGNLYINNPSDSKPKYNNEANFLGKTQSNLLQDTIPERFKEYQTVIDNFFQNSEKKILFITGINETGKTHLLRDLLLEAREKGINIIEGESDTTRAILPEKGQTLLFKDDIDREPEEFCLNLLKITDSSGDVKLIITSHSEWILKINKSIETIKDLTGKVERIKLKSWENSELCALLRIAADSKEISYNFYKWSTQFKSPKIIKYIGEYNKGKSNLDFWGIAQNIVAETKRVIEKICDNDFKEIETLVLNIIFEQQKESNLSESQKELFEKLQDVKVVYKTYSGQFLFYPIEKGIFYLATTLKDKSVYGIKGLLRSYSEDVNEIFVSQIANVLKYIPQQHQSELSKYVINLFSDWCDKLLVDNNFDNSEYIKSAMHIVDVEKDALEHPLTDKICKFILKILNYSQNNSNATWITLSNLLKNLIFIPEKREDYLEMLEKLWRSGWVINDYARAPDKLLSNAFKPIPYYNTDQSLEMGLDYATSWLNSEDALLEKMARISFKTLLAGTFEYIQTVNFVTEIGSKAILSSSTAFNIRSKAIDVLIEALKTEKLQEVVLDIMNDIGKTSGDYENLYKLPAYPKIQKEIEKCIPEIALLLHSNTYREIRFFSKTILIRWWLLNISTNMESWLLEHRDHYSAEDLLYYKLMGTPVEITDFKTIQAMAPSDDRMKWFCMTYERQHIWEHDSLVETLSAQYSNAQEIFRLIMDVIQRIPGKPRKDGRLEDYWQSVLSEIISKWVIKNPKIFKEILMSSEMSHAFPTKVRITIENTLANLKIEGPTGLIIKIIDKIPSIEWNELTQLVHLIREEQECKKKWVEAAIEKLDGDNLYVFSFYLNHIFEPESDFNSVASFLLKILKSDKSIKQDFFAQINNLHQYSVYQTYGLLFSKRDKLTPAIDEALRQYTFDWLVKIPDVNEYFTNVLIYCIRDVSHLTNLIEQRIEYWQSKQRIENQFLHVDILPRIEWSQEDLHHLFKMAENHQFFIDQIETLERNAMNVIPMLFPDWKSQIIVMIDTESGDLLIEKYLKEALNKNDINRIRMYCRYMPCKKEYIDTMLKAWQKIYPETDKFSMRCLLKNWINGDGTNSFDTSRDPSDQKIEIWEEVLQRSKGLSFRSIAKEIQEYLEQLDNFRRNG